MQLAIAVLVAAGIAYVAYRMVKAQGGPQHESVVTAVVGGVPAVLVLYVFGTHWHGGESSSTVIIDGWVLVSIEFCLVLVAYRTFRRPVHHLVNADTLEVERRRS